MLNRRIEEIVEKDLPRISSQLAENVSYLSNTFQPKIRVNNKAMVSFVDDDGQKQVYSLLKALVEEYNIPYTIAFPAGLPNVRPEVMTWEQLKSCTDNGLFKVISHNWTFDNLVMNDDATAEEHLRLSKLTLSQHDYDTNCFAYPQGQHNPSRRKMLLKYFNNACTTVWGLNDMNKFNRLQVNRVSFGGYYEVNNGLGVFEGDARNTIEYYKAVIDKAIAEKKWVVFMTHVWHQDHKMDVLEQLFQYIKLKESEIECLDYETAYNKICSPFETGDSSSDSITGYLKITNDSRFITSEILTNKLFKLLSNGTIKKITLIGDSIMEGVGSTGHITPPPSTQPKIFDNGGSNVFYEGGYTERSYANYFREYISANFPSVTFINKGIGGKSAKWANANKELWVKDEDFVIVMFGTNDRWDNVDLTGFKNDLTSFLKYVDDNSNNMLVISPPPALNDFSDDLGNVPNPTYKFGIKEIDRVITSLCIENKYDYLSFYREMLKLSRTSRTLLIDWLQGRTIGSHPIDKGHLVLWEIFQQSVGIIDNTMKWNGEPIVFSNEVVSADFGTISANAYKLITINTTIPQTSTINTFSYMLQNYLADGVLYTILPVVNQTKIEVRLFNCTSAPIALGNKNIQITKLK